MGLLDNIKFSMWDSVDATISLLEKWNPTSCKTEKDYENSLYTYLHSALKDIQITKQYAVGRTKADLMVGERIIVELKKDLSTTAQYQRLIGQITEYKGWKGAVVVLLVGKTDPNLKKEVMSYAKKSSFDLLTNEGKIIVFQKD
jgi:hypothetical protein